MTFGAPVLVSATEPEESSNRFSSCLVTRQYKPRIDTSGAGRISGSQSMTVFPSASQERRDNSGLSCSGSCGAFSTSRACRTARWLAGRASSVRIHEAEASNNPPAIRACSGLLMHRCIATMSIATPWPKWSSKVTAVALMIKTHVYFRHLFDWGSTNSQPIPEKLTCFLCLWRFYVGDLIQKLSFESIGSPR